MEKSKHIQKIEKARMDEVERRRSRIAKRDAADAAQADLHKATFKKSIKERGLTT